MKELEEIILWLETHNEQRPWREETANQILKIGEEFGEASAAWIAYQGQNPRKIDHKLHGTKRGQERVCEELLDVALTALVAANRLREYPDNYSLWDQFQDHIKYVRRRIDNGS